MDGIARQLLNDCGQVRVDLLREGEAAHGRIQFHSLTGNHDAFRAEHFFKGNPALAVFGDQRQPLLAHVAVAGRLPALLKLDGERPVRSRGDGHVARLHLGFLLEHTLALAQPALPIPLHRPRTRATHAREARRVERRIGRKVATVLHVNPQVNKRLRGLRGIGIVRTKCSGCPDENEKDSGDCEKTHAGHYLHLARPLNPRDFNLTGNGEILATTGGGRLAIVRPPGFRRALAYQLSLVTKLPPQMAWLSHWAKALAKFSMSARVSLPTGVTK